MNCPKNEFDVVLIGALRNLVEFVNIIDLLLHLKKVKHVNNIILSTWKGELENHPTLREHLLRSGVCIVEVNDVQSDYYKVSAHGNFLRQMKLFDEGLKRIPGNRIVIKARTDFCENELVKLSDRILTESFHLDKCQLPNSLFDKKLAVFHINVTRYFDINDTVFVGMKNDLNRLIHYTLDYDLNYLSSGIVPEMRWFLKAFSEKYPLFQSFFKLIQPVNYEKYLLTCLNKSGDLPIITLRIQALYLFILNHHFIIINDRKAELLDDFNIEDFFFPSIKGFSNAYRGNTKVIVHQKLITSLCRFNSTKYEKNLRLLLSMIEKLNTNNFGPDEITQNELQELYQLNNKYSFLIPQPKYTDCISDKEYSISKFINNYNNPMVNKMYSYFEEYQVCLTMQAKASRLLTFLINENCQQEEFMKFVWKFNCALCVPDASMSYEKRFGERWINEDISHSDRKKLRSIGAKWLAENFY